MHLDSSVVVKREVGLWECDLATGEIEFKNDYFKLLGLDKLGISFSDLSQLRLLIHPDDHCHFDAALSEASKTGGSISVAYRISIPGKTIQVNDRFIAYGNEGNLSGKLISYTEISDPENNSIPIHSVHEREVERLNKKYRTLVNALFPDFIFVFDEDFVIRDVILSERLHLLHEIDDLIGMNGYQLYSPEVCRLFLENMQLCKQDNQMKEIEYHLDLDDNRFYYRARIVAVEGNKFMALIHDIGGRIRRMKELITQRIRAEEADKMKSAFLANMSHEIRTPLNAIVGFTGFLSKELEPKKRKQYIEIIHNSSDMLLQLVNDILDLSRIEAGKSEIKFEMTDINALIREIRDIYKSNFNSDVKFKIIVPSSKISIYTDCNRLKQILFNLLSNAVKNTKKGSITLKVEKENVNLKFSVVDTGIGIPEDKLRTIFDRFEKLDSFAKGNGLGLSICESLVKCLGGDIKVESQYGVGSIFSFFIPYKNKDIPQKTTTQNEHIIHTSKLIPSYRKKILIAEDVEQDFMFAKNILEQKYDIIRAYNVDDVINYCLYEKPDLVLMAISLSMMSGLEVIKKIRAITSTVPIIAITTDNFYLEQKEALKYGCNDVLSKPYSASKLEEYVLAFL